MAGWGLLPLRLVMGLVFVMHGGQKLLVMGIAGTAGFFGQLGLPFPGLAAVAIIVLEIVGGLAMLLGFRTRVAALVLTLVSAGPGPLAVDRS